MAQPAAVTSANGWRALRQRTRELAAHDGAMTAAVTAALALYYLTPSPTLSLLELAAYAALAWLRLDIALCLLPLAFPFWYVPKRMTTHDVFPLSEVALAVCVAVALARDGWPLLRAGERKRVIPALRERVTALGSPLVLAIAGFALAGTLGVIVARRPHEALRDFRWEIVEPLLYLALMLLYVRDGSGLRRTVWAFLGSALVLAGLAAAQMTFAPVTVSSLAAGNQLVPLVPGSDGVRRATAFVYGSGNSLGAYLDRALPLALALALAPARTLTRRQRAIAALLCLAYIPALYWSASRGAWAATAAVVAIVACVAARRLWLLAATALLAVAAAVWQRGALIAVALAGHNSSGEVRTLVWLAAWHMIRDHPLLGIGLDQFLYYYSSRYTSHPYWITVLNGHPTLAWREPDLAQPHNLVLDLWLSLGVLGVVAVGVVLAIFWTRCARLWLRATRAATSAGVSAWTAPLALGLAGSMLAAVLHGMVDSAYFVPDLALLFWWTVAAALLAGREHTKPASPSRPSSPV